MEKRKNFFEQLLPEGVNIDYKFSPLDNSLMKIAWNSPNDGKPNLVDFLFSLEPYDIKIKDNH